MAETVQGEGITAGMAGCWVSGAANNSADEVNWKTIQAAREHGWEPEKGDVAWLASLEWPGMGHWAHDPAEDEMEGSASQGLTDMAEDALTYLNGKAPEGYLFRFDDGMYLLPVCGWEGFEREYEDCPHPDGECPNQ